MSRKFAQLIDRLKAGERGNDLDVLIEVALFKRDGDHVAARANAAGTKVIYTDHEGKDFTHWAPSWTNDPPSAIASLNAGKALPCS